MPNILPNPAKVTFILCEIARTEADGKLSLFGIYVGEEISVNGAASNPSVPIPALAPVFLIDDGEGTFDSVVEITGPIGNPIRLPMTVNLKPKIRGAVAGQIFGLPLSAGQHKVDLVLDGTHYPFKFNVKFT